MFDKIAELSMLFDFYGELLPEKQKTFLTLYHEENYSLSEIAEEFGISRQGVHDGVKKAERALYELEEKLGLVKKFGETEAALRRADELLTELIAERKDDLDLTAKLNQIKAAVDTLEE